LYEVLTYTQLFRPDYCCTTTVGNRVDRSVNYTTLAEKLEGYTGSDIKEVCREAVVRVAHERAKMLEHGVVEEWAAAGKRRSIGDVYCVSLAALVV
jgi:SpoVK/Ycf46/Vps4 family AAA+-type ATPase